MSDDLSHDTHLRAALRHAPDHALVPPAGISQTILSAARHMHRPVRAAATAAPVVRVTVAPPRALAWLRQWFSSPRLAGGLATGLVAALGLGLWLDLGDQPVIERPAVDTTAQMRSAPEPVTPSGAGVGDTRDAEPVPATEATRPRSQAAPGAAAKATVQERKAERAQPPATAEPARREQAAAQEAEAAVAKAVAPAAPPAPMADTAATPTPAAPTAPAEVARLTQRSDASSRSEQRMLSAAGRAAAAAAPDGARAMAPETGAAADAASAGSPAFALLRRARAESAAGAARWAWTPPGSPLMAPFDDAGQAWLARLAQATRGRWTDVAERSGSGDAIEVRWWRDEWPQATLRLEADGVRWTEQGGRIRFAPLEAAALARLRSP